MRTRFGRAIVAHLRWRGAPAGRARACSPCCAAASPGLRFRASATMPLDEQRQWQALGVAPLVERRRHRHADGADRGGRADRFRAQARGRGRRRRAATAAAGACAARTDAHSRPGRRRALLVAARRRRLARRSPRNISPRWRPRSTSATCRPSDGFDLVLGREPRTALRRARPRRGRPTCSWCAGPRTAAANGSTPPTPTRPAPVGRRHGDAGRTGRSPPISAIAITRSCTSPASTPGSTSAPAGAARSSPPPTARSSAPAGPAAMAARSRSPTAAGSSASMAT